MNACGLSMMKRLVVDYNFCKTTYFHTVLQNHVQITFSLKAFGYFV